MHNLISYLGNMASFHWNGNLDIKVEIYGGEMAKNIFIDLEKSFGMEKIMDQSVNIKCLIHYHTGSISDMFIFLVCFSVG